MNRSSLRARRQTLARALALALALTLACSFALAVDPPGTDANAAPAGAPGAFSRVLQGIRSWAQTWSRGRRAPEIPAAAPAPQAPAVPASQPTKAEQILAVATTNVTAEAVSGRYPAFVGRGNDLVLLHEAMRRSRNRLVWLVAGRGEGKTEMVREFARLFAQEKTVYALDLAALAANAREPGALESSLRAIVRIFQSDPSKILFIDEGLFVALDERVLGVLRGPLMNGDLGAILATTPAGLRAARLKDEALGASGQILEPRRYARGEIQDILRAHRARLEAHYEARLSEPALTEATRLAMRYFSGYSATNKALDLIESALAYLGSEPRFGGPVERELRDRISALEREAQSHALDRPHHADDSEDSARIERRLAEIATERAEAERKLAEAQATRASLYAPPSAAGDPRPQVTPRLLQEIVARSRGESAERIARAPQQALATFLEETNARVRGQSHVFRQMRNALARSMQRVDAARGPIGVFLLMGKTGTGKTQSAISVNESLFGSRDSFVRLDMSEFMERHNVSRLIGAPPGYVGYEAGGELTNPIQDNGQRVILIDEIEKAHADVRKIFLQIFDEGTIKDGQGRDADFRNCVFIVTTNIGAQYSTDKIELSIEQIEGKYGFEPGQLANLDADAQDRAVLAKLLQDAGWKPEEINRYLAIIRMNPISLADAALIARDQLDRMVLHNRVENSRAIVYDDDLPTALAEAGWDPEYGVRPLERTRQNTVSLAIADATLSPSYRTSDTLRLRVRRDGAAGPSVQALVGDTVLASQPLAPNPASIAVRRLSLECRAFAEEPQGPIPGLENIITPHQRQWLQRRQEANEAPPTQPARR